MGANRFMVLRFKDIVKTAVFAVLGIAFFAVVIYMILGFKGTHTAMYVPGTYLTEINLSQGNLTVEVKVGKNKIKAVNITNASETVPVFYPLFQSTAQAVEKQVLKEQTADFVVDSDTPVTERMLLEAVEENLKKARAK